MFRKNWGQSFFNTQYPTLPSNLLHWRPQEASPPLPDPQHVRPDYHIAISKISMELTPSVISTIETFEILQNHQSIEALNTPALAEYLQHFSKEYSDEAADYIISHRTYKKSTIAFLSHCLDYLGVFNDLEKYLSPLSDYRIRTMEAIFA